MRIPSWTLGRSMTILQVIAVCMAVSALQLRAAEPAAGEKGKWVVIHKGVEIDQKQKDGTTVKKPGGVSSLAVDRKTGDLFLFLNGSGLWKSTDQGKTFTQLNTLSGRCARSESLSIDPEDGKRIACYAGSATLTLDGGKTWEPLKSLTGDGDFLQLRVDWTDPQAKTIIAVCGGHSPRVVSKDRGQTWSPIDNWPWFSGIFDAQTWFRANNQFMERTEDAGQTWTKVEPPFAPGGLYVTVFKGVGYYLSKDGMMVTKDKAKTWTTVPLPKRQSAHMAPQGPFFGKDEKHMMIVDDNGFFESKDAGQTWTQAASMALTLKEWPRTHHIGFASAWDPVHDILYFCVSEYGMNAYKFQR